MCTAHHRDGEFVGVLPLHRQPLLRLFCLGLDQRRALCSSCRQRLRILGVLQLPLRRCAAGLLLDGLATGLDQNIDLCQPPLHCTQSDDG